MTRVRDVRQRRGVRGSEYAWANARRLQAALAEAGFEYLHAPELAPTTPPTTPKGSASARAPSLLPERGVAALLCVERDPEACHRSLVAARVGAELGAEVVHLRP